MGNTVEMAGGDINQARLWSTAGLSNLLHACIFCTVGHFDFHAQTFTKTNQVQV